MTSAVLPGAPFRPGPRCDHAAAWQTLTRLWDAQGRDLDMRAAFAADPQRASRYTWEAAGLRVDVSKQRWNADIQAALTDLARECALEAHRDALFDGQAINTTEGRAVLHMALRHPQRWPGRANAEGLDEVVAVRERMLAFADQVRAEGSPYTDIVNIGIGGSDLGPQMVVRALAPHTDARRRYHFVSNVDAADLQAVLDQVRPESTLFIVASKTFTTQETLANARLAKAWFLREGGSDIARHFVGVTTNLKAAADFGVTTTFGFWDWVGGRYSLWSSIGLPIAIAIGSAAFRDFLAGAHAMDEHFRTAPLATSLPVQMALLDLWNRDFVGCPTRAIAPYSQALQRLPAYLQQLEMESNGKSVDFDGQPIAVETSPVIWGEPGTNGQHAFFQMIHQGTDVVPVEFILIREPDHPHRDAHDKLLANGLAQAQALLQGKPTDEARQEQAPTASRELDPDCLARHRTFSGNRPSTLIALDRLTPARLGALIALYEHRVFVMGSLWGLNSFDQWGVELGKALCSQLLGRISAVREGQADAAAGLDASTAGQLAWFFGPR
ncbi:glucose-6-phosphate isomerase [Amphibiibacter pelophylacis]|uniref:Glucose-6-phosphate isomerase n=1 Tax=Amphibiibacter pelophylacis TaxID=1799477 RepID=A0ACC6P1S9_9BURK